MSMFLKVIACEIALREICFTAAQAPHLVDLEFLPQGYHDTPAQGREFVQERVNAVPPGKYDAILLGYGLCGNIINGLKTPHTPLVIPRAHDCITFFLGSHERYQKLLESRPGAYYYTAGWLEVLRRRGDRTPPNKVQFLPTRAGMADAAGSAYDEWVKRYGEERAKYLLEVMDRWTENYTHGVFVEFDFNKVLHLKETVQSICDQRGWQYEEIEGDLRLLQYWLDGEWDPKMFLVVRPGEEVAPSYDDRVITSKAVA
jgi:hypothetical protein